MGIKIIKIYLGDFYLFPSFKNNFKWKVVIFLFLQLLLTNGVVICP